MLKIRSVVVWSRRWSNQWQKSNKELSRVMEKNVLCPDWGAGYMDT